MSRTIGRVMLSVTALFAVLGAFYFDWNETHIYNPRWPPHAKFHNAQTMTMAVLLCAATVYFAWRRQGDRRTNAFTAALIGSLYWVSQAIATRFPDVSWTDPEFLQPGQSLADVGPQLIMDPILLALVALGWLLMRRGSETGAHAAPR